MAEEGLSRRRFLGRATAGAAAAGVGTLISVQGFRATEGLSIGLIGCGGHGVRLATEIQALAQRHSVAITALCDVWRVNLSRAAASVKAWFGREPRTFTRFGDLLALPDVDAVVIATPDFTHTPILLAALRAGKDVFVEKPMSLEIAEANEALDAARASPRIVQVGTQRRSEGLYPAIARELARGVLGQISRVSVAAHFNQARWARSVAGCRESDVDWDAFLLNRPRRPFDARLLRQWQLYREFTHGPFSLWMTHHADIVHLMTGSDYPTSAVAHGGIYVWRDGREHPDTVHALLEYPRGFLLDWAMSLGNSAGGHFTIHGTEGTLDVERGWLSPTGGGASSKLASRRIEPFPSQPHVGNWLRCLRTRQTPNADVACGHQHSVATILAAAAFRTGRRQRYDRERRVMAEG